LDIKKREFTVATLDEAHIKEVEDKYSDDARSARHDRQRKITSYAAVDALKKEVVESYAGDEEKRLLRAQFSRI
jgi:hypothetical protein